MYLEGEFRQRKHNYVSNVGQRHISHKLPSSSASTADIAATGVLTSIACRRGTSLKTLLYVDDSAWSDFMVVCVFEVPLSRASDVVEAIVVDDDGPVDMV